MLQRLLLVCVTVCAICAMAATGKAQCTPAYPFSFTNGTIADANQVMSNFNAVMSCATTNANITAGTISGLSSFAIGTDQFSGVFGSVPMFVEKNQTNVILGQLLMDAPPNTTTLPVATIGACKLTALTTTQGNTCFGLYGLAELRSGPSGVGVAIGGEVTSRNFTGVAATTALPPNTGFGTNQAVADGFNITCGAEVGNSDCSIGLYITNESGLASDPRFNTAAYLSLYKQFGLFVEAQPSGSQTSAVLKNNGTGINLQLQTTGGETAANAVLTVVDMSAVSHFNIRQNGDAYMNTLQYTGHSTTPTLSACGSGANVVSGSTDSHGIITVGSGTTTCVVTFGTNFTTQVPTIIVGSEVGSGAFVSSHGLNGFGVSGLTQSTNFDYVVMSSGS